MRFREVSDQREALKVAAELTQKAILDPLVRSVAARMVKDVEARDDKGELEAIYQAVKHGTPHVKGLERGIKYMADPRAADWFTYPGRTLKQAMAGVAIGDCDDHAMLVAALLGSLGWRVGLRIWGEKGEDFTHIYPVVVYPKRADGPQKYSAYDAAGEYRELGARAPRNEGRIVALDTTVDHATVGWEPPGGHTLTALLE